jgi:membrane protein
VQSKHITQLAAGLSYYLILSLFPCLIALAAALALLPWPHLFDHMLVLMGEFVPPDSMGLVRAVLKDVVTPHGGRVFSVGILLMILAASGGVDALIEAINIAYELPEKRTFVRRRLLAIVLLFALGVLMILGLSLLVVGPGFGRWLADKVGVGPVFVALWPYLRWALSIACAVLAIELIYIRAPEVRRSLRSTLPGAVVGLMTWLALSSGLGIFFRNFGHLNKTYGALAAAIALMLWLQWTAFAILLGAEFNVEMERLNSCRRLPLEKEQHPAAILRVL